MERHIRLVPHDPTVVSWSYVENITGAHFNDAAVFHCSGRFARHDHTNMLHVAHGRPDCSPNIDGPFPTRLIRSPPDRHTANLNQLELSFRERSDLIRLIKPFQDYLQHREHSACSSSKPAPKRRYRK